MSNFRKDFFEALDELIAETPIKCDNCLKVKITVPMKRGIEWKNICDFCAISIKPYLKPTPEMKVEKFGDVRIYTPIKDVKLKDVVEEVDKIKKKIYRANKLANRRNKNDTNEKNRTK
jgi:hypothetical protein